MARVVISIVNNKGGVGKTTTSVSLAAALATPRRRVLLVDLDSQASASSWCGVPRARLVPSIATCLLHNQPIDEAIRKTSTAHLDLVTGSLELANADLALCDVRGRELTLTNALQPVAARYDTVILDCPPGLSLIGINALLASDAFIVPVIPQHLAIDGLVSFLAMVDQVRKRLAARVWLLGILLTMFDKSREAVEARERLAAEYRERLFHTEIGRSRAIAAAPAKAQTIYQFAPRSPAAEAYLRLTGELLERLRQVKRW